MGERGFLLVEVLLSLLLVAAVGALAVSFRAQAAAAEFAVHETTAVFLAQKRRALVLAGGAPVEASLEKNGSLFTVSSQKTSGQNGACAVLVRVCWQERGQARCVCLPVAVDAPR